MSSRIFCELQITPQPSVFRYFQSQLGYRARATSFTTQAPVHVTRHASYQYHEKHTRYTQRHRLLKHDDQTIGVQNSSDKTAFVTLPPSGETKDNDRIVFCTRPTSSGYHLINWGSGQEVSQGIRRTWYGMDIKCEFLQ